MTTKHTQRRVLSVEEIVRNSSHVSHDWWVFFPLFGLDVRSTIAALNRPLFGDATIVSYRSLRTLIRTAPSVMIDGKSSNKLVLEFLELERALEGEYHAAIGVRRRMRLERSVPGSAPPETVDRARRLAAALTLALAPHDQNGALVGLVERVPARAGGSRVLFTDHLGVFPLDSRKSRSSQQLPLLTMSRGDVRRALRAADVAPFARVLTSVRPSLPGSLNTAVVEAALRLADGILADEPAVQLLAAVTCMEILLCERSDYDALRRRALVLVCEHASEVPLKEVLDARHHYVHGGRTDGAERVQPAAFALALRALARYAALAPSFKCRSDLLRFLDIEQARRNCSVDDRRIRSALRRITSRSVG